MMTGPQCVVMFGRQRRCPNTATTVQGRRGPTRCEEHAGTPLCSHSSCYRIIDTDPAENRDGRLCRWHAAMRRQGTRRAEQRQQAQIEQRARFVEQQQEAETVADELSELLGVRFRVSRVNLVLDPVDAKTLRDRLTQEALV